MGHLDLSEIVTPPRYDASERERELYTRLCREQGRSDRLRIERDKIRRSCKISNVLLIFNTTLLILEAANAWPVLRTVSISALDAILNWVGL
jgi:hypothetical protein